MHEINETFHFLAEPSFIIFIAKNCKESNSWQRCNEWLIIKCKYQVIFHHDNATPHPPYSPDFGPSDYYLFRSLQNSSNGKTFNDDEAVKSHLVQFFDDKDQKFCERGITNLPEGWQKVIERNGKYIIN